uniref:Chromosome segregation protein of the smc family n=1 Tax=Encephalitozoon cuniculi TaxID=6035 RepID=M1KAQ6_ENCCN|nr:chromosome segregation protein of the smc family [Encephalitozoon cuniculi]
MHIKQIRLKNFRSFRDEVVVPLSEHTNIIVGRNGSGKSSIVSAVHFVLCGEKHSCESRTGLIHEGSRAMEEEGSVEIVFCDGLQEAGSGREFSVKRTVSVKKDEYMVDNRIVSRDELVGLLQTNGFAVGSPYFVVLQEEVSELAVVDDRRRYELMKNVAGVSGYEKDRESSMSILEETKQSEKKIELLLERVEDKLRGLESDKKEAELCEELEKEKRRLEYGYIEREVREINGEIFRIEELVSSDPEEVSEESGDFGCEIGEIENKLTNLINRRKELHVNEKYKDKEPEIKDEMKKIEKKRSDLQDTQKVERERLVKLRDEERENFVRSGYIKYLTGFLETLGSRNIKAGEIETAKSILKEKLEKLRALNSSGRHEAENAEETRDLEELIERRKHLWREEKRLRLLDASIEEMVKSQENRLMAMGNIGLDVHSQIKCEEGVLGYVYDLISVPNELVNAFEAVVGNALFNIVVSNEEVASKVLKKMKDLRFRITLMPLSRIKYRESEEVKDPDVISLTSQLRCGQQYKALLRCVVKDFYLCSDLKQALYSSKKYEINTVTLSGEIVTRDGPISGGYEKRNAVFQEYKKISREARKVKGEISRVQHELGKIGKEIEEAKMSREKGSDGSRYNESLKSVVLFLQEKIRILEEASRGDLDINKINVKLRRLREEEKDLRLKSIWTGNEIRKVEIRVGEAEIGIKKLNDSSRRLESELEKSKMYGEAMEIEAKILELKDKKRAAREMMFNEENAGLFAKPKKINIEMEKLVRRKHMLINKRSELCERIGASDFRNLERLYPDKKKEEIINEMARINERTRGLSAVNRAAISQWENYMEQRDSMKRRLEDLKCDKRRILDFIAELDSKKEDTMRNAISLVKEGFSELYSRLTDGGTAELYSYENGIGIKIGENISANLLSGGQKAVVALCLIFSMQRVSPSPLYVLDEIDANLDVQSRERVSMLIKEMSTSCGNQFIITTFRKELLSCGSKYLSVEFEEKRSRVKEIEMVTAYRFLDEDAGES